MRSDALGLFWRDEPVVKVLKEKIKCVPPDPVWEKDTYLPSLEEARLFNVPLFTDHELVRARYEHETLLYDIECYWNYFLASFKSIESGRIVFVEVDENTDSVAIDLARRKLEWILENFMTVGFNSNSYDIPVTTIFLGGGSPAQCKKATNMIILEEIRGWEVARQFKAKRLECDHIDLIEVAPLRGSLKAYGGRVHTRRMWDLPFHPERVLTAEQKLITRFYNINDLDTTGDLKGALAEQLKLRVLMSHEYKIDLRSKSDAQIAEAVISDGIKRLNGGTVPARPQIPPGTVYRYKVPEFIGYQSPLMNSVLNTVAHARFVVAEHGSIIMPPEIGDLLIKIGNGTYQMGIGGLHSQEKKVTYRSDQNYIISDRDVVSYYPMIILNQGLFPYHLGPAFLRIFNSIVQRRLKAKADGNKVDADSLKITINGSFGKLGSKYSNLYSPDLLIQVTITGQLALLMLIETLEMAGITVISANTDGVTIRCHRSLVDHMNAIVKWWEQRTQFEMEEMRYAMLCSRDVNNYIAVKYKYDKAAKQWTDQLDGAKLKGAYAPAGLHKNPVNEICAEAVVKYLTEGVALQTTIDSCNDIRKFVTVRAVKGGAVKVWSKIPLPAHNSREELVQLAGFTPFFDREGMWAGSDWNTNGPKTLDEAYRYAQDVLSPPAVTEFLGKTIRWYYAEGMEGEIVYAGSGNKVPRTDGAMPVMTLPDSFPSNLDRNWYLDESIKILKEIGFLQA